MKASLKKKWVAALRSGDYKQGRNSLKQGKGDKATYCCLGVLCEIEGLRRAPTDFLTESQLKKVGMSGEMQQRLAKMNDAYRPDCGHQYSFKRIATYIEKHL